MSEPETKGSGWKRWFDVTTPILSLVARLRGGRPVSEAWSKKRSLLPYLMRGFWVFFNRKMLRRYAFALACLVTLIALAYGIENWRGKKAWETYKAEVTGRGETLDFKAYIPPPVPDDQNFAVIPLFQPLFHYKTRLKWGSSLSSEWFVDSQGADRLLQIHEMDTSAKEFPQGIWTNSWHQGRKLDLTAWQIHYRSGTKLSEVAESSTPAADVLAVLKRFDPQFAELEQAAGKPYSRFPVDYESIQENETDTAYLHVLGQIVQVLRLRASARLQHGDAEGAAADIDLMFRLADSVRQEPLVISQLVRARMLRILMQPLWEGMQDQRWTEAQLNRWREGMKKLHVLEDFRTAVLGQRALMGPKIIRLGEQPKRFLDYVENLRSMERNGAWSPKYADLFPRPGPEFLIVAGMPRGWWYFESVSFCRCMDAQLLDGLPGLGEIIDLRKIKQGHDKREAWLKQQALAQRNGTTWKPLLDREVVTSFYYIASTMPVIIAQVNVDLAITAIVLERHRINTGGYPLSLNELPSQLRSQLPLDKMSGQPFRYQKEGDSFRLWSIGWDGKDDQGKVVENKLVGDWIWHPRPLPDPAK